jgi:hypothetical protein
LKGIIAEKLDAYKNLQNIMGEDLNDKEYTLIDNERKFALRELMELSEQW